MRDFHDAPLLYDSYSSSSSTYNHYQPSTATTMFTSELASTDIKRQASGDRDGDLHDPVRRTKQQRRLSPTSSLHPTIMATRPRWEVADEYALADEDDEQEVVSYANYWEDRWGQQSRSKSQRPNSVSSFNYPSATASSSQHMHSYNYYSYPSHSPDSDNTILSDEEDYEFDNDDSHSKRRRVSRIFAKAVRRHRHVSEPIVVASTSTAIETSTTTAPSSAPPAITINNDPFLDSYPQNHPMTPSRSARSRASRRSYDGAYSLPASPMHRPSSLLEQDEDDHRRSNHVEEDEEEAEAPQKEYTPTCMDGIRQQWQAIALRVQISMFHAQKRFKGRRQRVKTRLGLTSQSS